MTKVTPSILSCAVSLALLSGCQVTESQGLQADYLITGGKVFLGDGSGLQLVDIAICDNKICAIEPSAQEGSWIVEFRHARGGFVLLTDSHGEECHYIDVDLASKSAMAVGFKQVRIEAK